MQVSFVEEVHSTVTDVIFVDSVVIYYLLYDVSRENHNCPYFVTQKLDSDQVVQLEVFVELQRLQKKVSLDSIKSVVAQSFRQFGLYFRSGQL